MEENTFVNERQSEEQNAFAKALVGEKIVPADGQEEKNQKEKSKILPQFSSKDEEALTKLITLNPAITELPRKTLECFINGASADEIVTGYENMLMKEKINDLQLMLKAEKKNAFNKKTAVTGIESDGAMFAENEFISGLYSVFE